MKKIRLGLIGCGVVGGGVLRLLHQRKSDITARVGAEIEVVKIAVRDLAIKRPDILNDSMLTTDPFEIVNSNDVDIVVEVMGGENPAFELALSAVKNEKHIVTANKLLLALHGEKVFRAVEDGGVEIGFEAAVAGAVPIISSLKGALAANRIDSLYGIVNGTANYILSRMTDEGGSFSEILKDAQKLGYAEADPAFDVEGDDAAHKVAILASLAFETPVDFNDIYVEGITSITPEDIAMAREFGYRIKLLAIAKRVDGGIDVRVHPAMVPEGEPIAQVSGALNAVEVDGDFCGVNMLVGPGAGSGPTASAIVGDVMDIARKIVAGVAGTSSSMNVPVISMKKLPVRSIGEVTTQYYLRFTVTDRPGVLSKLSGALGERGISIASMLQRGEGIKKPVSVMMMTHTAREADLTDAITEINKFDICSAPAVVIRMENGGER